MIQIVDSLKPIDELLQCFSPSDLSTIYANTKESKTRSKDHIVPRSWFLNTTKRGYGPLKKWLIPEWEKESTKRAWKILLNWKLRKFLQNDGTSQKDTDSNWQDLHWPHLGQSEHHYNVNRLWSPSKIEILEFILK